MPVLFETEGDDLHPGYLNLRIGRHRREREMAEALEALYQQFSPYADPDFVSAFARDPEARFWEMWLGCALLEGGKTLLPTVDRRGDGGPDICVLENDKRMWIEAIAPGLGEGDDGIPRPPPINRGGRLREQPVRQTQLRITSALRTKNCAIVRYLEDDIIDRDDIAIVAIGAARFGIYAMGPGFPLALSAVFPIGDAFVRIDRETMEVVEAGHETALEIPRTGGINIPRTAFLDDEYQHLSGLLWSRVGIGNWDRTQRPLSFIHNPSAQNSMPQEWGVCDREFVAIRQEHTIEVSDILAKSSDNASS